MKLRVVGSVLVCGLLATPALLAAEVRWVAPPGCTDSGVVVEEAERLLGRPLATVEAIDFEVWITDRDGKWRLQLNTVARATGERAERILDGKSCDEVASAAAVALAMVVNSHEAAEPMENEPSTDEPPPGGDPPEGSPQPQPKALRDAPPGQQLRGSLALAGVGDLGAFPSLGFGAMAVGAATYGSLRLMAFGEVLVNSHEQGAGQAADFVLTNGGLLACLQRPLGSATAWLCGGAELGRLSGTGVGIENPQSGGALWWAPRADVGASFPFEGGLSIVSQVGLVAPQIRPTFVLDEVLVYRPVAISGRLSLGLELSLE
ncbi:MAG: hypothetical protein RJA70_4102 [Pseudomonadota bacterium]|jgi:hypothetical protein